MQKYIEDGQVAILVSRTYGSGWYSWNSNCLECLFHPEIVALVKDKEALRMTWRSSSLTEREFDEKIHAIVVEIERRAKELFGKDFYPGGASGLNIKWLDQGQAFRISEYDGKETIEYADGEWITA